MKVNPLLLIAGIFAASFAGRAIGMANAALNRPEAPKAQETLAAAREPLQLMSHDETPEASKTEPPAVHKDPAAKPAPALIESASASHKAAQYNELLDAIRERSIALDNKAAQVEDRIRVLEIIEERIEEKLSELQKSNEELSKLVSFANDASQQDIALLAKMYEQMKPQRAGEIFDQMNPTFAAGFLTEMNSENAALILTNMSTEKAYAASMIIASRNAAVHQ